MKHLLDRSQRGVLALLTDALLVFDFDGTLAPIVRQPDQARMRARTRELLSRLAERQPVAVVSGRSRDDLVHRLDGVPARYLVGNHGGEWPHEARLSSAARRRVVRWKRTLVLALRTVDGVEIEDKVVSLALHYRRARAVQVARRAVEAATARLADEAVVVPGKRVVNLTLPGHDKGEALARLRARFRGRPTLFVGDDVNDEPALGAREPGLVTARVGRHLGSRAQYFLRSQREIDALLGRLLVGAAH
jgi:trehalose 6-phosphate phosphatase